MANTPMTPDAVVMHAVVAARLSEEGRLKKDGEVIKYTRIALAAVPDGWAKIEGEWVFQEPDDDPCSYCDDNGWVEDKNWQPEHSGQLRRFHNGLIPCGGDHA